MTFKKLTEEDFVTGYASIVGGEKAVGDANSAGINIKKRLANIVNGGEINIDPNSITSYAVLKREDFKERIHMPSLEVGGSPIPYGPENVLTSGAGEAYKSGNNIYVFPEVGIIIGSADVSANSERIITTSHVFIRVPNKEFNYSMNPSFSNIQGTMRYPEMADDPVVYITTIGLYNDNGDLLAVAKVPPTKKTFHDEVLFELQLDF